MKSILEDIYYGRRCYCENIEAGEEYWEVHKEYDKIYEELEKGLNDDQKKILDELFITTGGLEDKLACAHFKEGFKIGLLVAIEAFSR